jgi:hypothetical protein
MRAYLQTGDLRAHFWRALLMALVLRLLSAYFVYGPQALDDYKHGVWPAYQFFAGLDLTDFPGYRSHLLVWFLAGFVKIASFFGVSSALAQVRSMYVGLALTSLLGVLGTYFYASLRPQALASRLMLYLIAAGPLMPFVSTRAFGEAVALSFVLLGFGCLEWARARADLRLSPWLLGFLSLGIATLFRFHCGILYFGYAGVLIYQRRTRAVMAAFLAGVIVLLAQAAIDWGSGKAAFETLILYLQENEGGGARYGVSPWYTTWIFILALALFPFSLPLFRQARAVWREQWPILVPALLFILAHTVAPHKEERFMYPVIGLEFWAIADLWACSADDKWSRRLFSPLYLFVTAVLLVVACFANSQEGEIEPPAYVESHYHNVMYLDYASLFGQSRFQFYFLRPPSQLQAVQPTDFTAARIDNEFLNASKRDAVVLLTSEPEVRDQLRLLENVRTVAGQCLRLREAGSPIDRLLYKMNPKHNQRRRPTWYLICERLPGV